MNIPIVYTKDTHGALTYDVLKHDKEAPAVIAHDDNENLIMSYSNIDYASIPGLSPNHTSYLFFLTYNGTNKRNKMLFSTILLQETGILDIFSPPSFTYSVNGEVNKYIEGCPECDQTIIDINFYTREANILRFNTDPGLCTTDQNRIPNIRYTYPFKVTVAPNVEDNEVQYDGWYTATFAVIKDIYDEANVLKGDIIGYNGKVYLVPVDGEFAASENEGVKDVIISPDGVTHELFDITYEQFILAANGLLDFNTGTTTLVANSQILVTKRINETIIDEVKKVNTDYTGCETYNLCSIDSWQKMQQKRIAAYILWLESNFNRAQIVVESARESCRNNSDNCKI
jgi:hypothetical protein